MLPWLSQWLRKITSKREVYRRFFRRSVTEAERPIDRHFLSLRVHRDVQYLVSAVHPTHVRLQSSGPLFSPPSFKYKVREGKRRGKASGLESPRKNRQVHNTTITSSKYINPPQYDQYGAAGHRWYEHNHLHTDGVYGTINTRDGSSLTAR